MMSSEKTLKIWLKNKNHAGLFNKKIPTTQSRQYGGNLATVVTVQG